ncbi:2159_t:CDS:2, partial [Gigaspora margarita]
TLKNVDMGVKDANHKLDVISQDINILKTQIANQQSDVHAQRINPNELINPTENEFRGHGSHIIKKIYKTYMIEVACKSIEEEDFKNLEGELAILGKLGQSPYILHFYGLSATDTNNVMVSEWAGHGTLKELYNSSDIPWTRKIQIIRDICRGLIFLRHVNIFHHDLRCENIFVLHNLDPKLGNFRYAREMTDYSKNLGDIYQKQIPHQRIDITSLGIKLEKLAVNYPISSQESILLKNKTLNFEGEKKDISSFDLLIPLEKGIEFHKKKDYKNAWKCFEENANLGNITAKYWQGYYLLNGYDIYRYVIFLFSNLKKDDDEAIKQDNCNKILHYFKLVADNMNVEAMYYLGDIYFKGKLRVEKNEELGLVYLRLAAKKGHEKAIKLLKELKELKKK